MKSSEARRMDIGYCTEWYKKYYQVSEVTGEEPWSVSEGMNEAHILRFANLLHKKFEVFSLSSSKLIDQSESSGLVIKLTTGKFLEYLNRSSVVLQQIAQKLRNNNRLIYTRVKKLIDYLHTQIDTLRVRCMKLLKSSVAIKYQFSCIIRQVNKCVCL